MRKLLTEDFKREVRDFYLSKPMSLLELGKKFDICSITASRILGDIPKYSRFKIFNPDANEDFF